MAGKVDYDDTASCGQRSAALRPPLTWLQIIPSLTKLRGIVEHYILAVDLQPPDANAKRPSIGVVRKHSGGDEGARHQSNVVATGRKNESKTPRAEFDWVDPFAIGHQVNVGL